jgi:hypothetical protein
MQVPDAPIVRDAKSDEGARAIQFFMDRIAEVARSISFLDAAGGTADGRKPVNLDAVWVQYVSNASADTEDTVAHNLGRIPVGFLIGLPDKSAIIYESGTAMTLTDLYLKSSATSTTVNLLVF